MKIVIVILLVGCFWVGQSYAQEILPDVFPDSVGSTTPIEPPADEDEIEGYDGKIEIAVVPTAEAGIIPASGGLIVSEGDFLRLGLGILRVNNNNGEDWFYSIHAGIEAEAGFLNLHKPPNQLTFHRVYALGNLFVTYADSTAFVKLGYSLGGFMWAKAQYFANDSDVFDTQIDHLFGGPNIAMRFVRHDRLNWFIHAFNTYFSAVKYGIGATRFIGVQLSQPILTNPWSFHGEFSIDFLGFETGTFRPLVNAGVFLGSFNGRMYWSPTFKIGASIFPLIELSFERTSQIEVETISVQRGWTANLKIILNSTTIAKGGTQ